MSKKSGEWGKLPIPSDWDEAADGYQLVALCIPNSRQWRAILVGQISDLAYGRKWNRNTGTITEVQALAREIFETMSITCLDDIAIALECICNGTTVLAEKSGQAGQAAEGSLSDGVIETGEGQQFPDQESYFNAKCNSANGIFDTILGMIDWLRDNDVDMLAGLFGGVTSGLLVAAALAGPVGWAWALVSSLVVSLAGFIIAYALNFSDVSDALDDTHEECVMALYNAADSITAEDNFIAAVEAGSPTITAIEASFLRILLSAEILNQLFEPREDVAAYESSDPVDCGSFILKSWTFPADVEGWTFTDDSDPSCSATRSYEATEEAIRNTLVVASLPFVRATGTNDSPAVTLAVTPGAAVQVDFSATSDAPILANVAVTAFYSDATSETDNVDFGAAGTLVLTLTQSKTITSVQVQFARSTSGSAQGSTHFQDLQEVRVVSA